MAAAKNKRFPDRYLPLLDPVAFEEVKAHPPVVSRQLAIVLSEFLATRWRKGVRLCVALSGGRDSVVLLHALHCLSAAATVPVSLSAIHVHHGLSPDADVWAEFCADFCVRLGVPLAIIPVDVPRDRGEGLEAAARRARHAVFAGVDADWLALAHHRDDQAETVLLNLLRGAGVAGAAGMLPERQQANGPVLIRPLLDVSRRLLEGYAQEQGLAWIDDESNDNVHFRRNFLRHEILPRLTDLFPGTSAALSRAAGHFAEGSHLLDDLARIDRAASLGSSGRISLAGFNALSPARARNLLRFVWVESGFRAPDARWIDEALRQFARSGPLSETCLSTVDGELRVYRGELYFCAHSTQPELRNIVWNGEPELPWAGGKLRFVTLSGAGIRRESLPTGSVSIRSRQGGERLQPDTRRPRRTLRNLLQEAGIPPWERARLPYLWCGDRLVWVAGLGVDGAFSCPPDATGILPVWEARSG